MIERRTFLSMLTATATALVLPGCATPRTYEPVEPVTLTKGPYLLILDATTASLRFETREDLPVQIQIIGPEGIVHGTARRRAEHVGLPWGMEISGNPLDEEGEHVLHEIVLTDLTPGATYRWRLQASPDVVKSGRFRAPPSPTSSTVVAFIADTMYPSSAGVAAMLASHEPEVVVHGGDIQYRTNPADTWNGFFLAMEPLLALGPYQACFGNHELDEPEEAEYYFDRLWAGQGASSTPRYHAIPWGPLLLLCLDSETSDLGDPQSPQVAWAHQTLAEAREKGLHPVLFFHRPTYTLSKYGPRNLNARQVVHDLATTYDCPAVLAGHVHGYERFEVDGIVYLIDGGGGALLTNLEERRDEIEDARPGEPDLRQVAHRSFGGTILRVDDGTLRIERYELDGTLTDQVDITL
ncbi:MAG: hypothetical protein EA397_00175 [Deltaproteobacteria bacterium]|nr:MAG: hypothetical protein EA397_00175 [Deltaproteobacteria bacterium]